MAIAISLTFAFLARQSNRASDVRVQPYKIDGTVTGGALSGAIWTGSGGYVWSGNVPNDTHYLRRYMLQGAGESANTILKPILLEEILARQTLASLAPMIVNGAFTANALQNAPNNKPTFAVPAVVATLGETSDGYIRLIAGDDKSAAIFFEDGRGNPVAYPADPSGALLDASGAEIGTVTVTDSKTSIGYLLMRLQVPSSGNLPAKLRITFDGGAGGAYSHDIPVRCNA